MPQIVLPALIVGLDIGTTSISAVALSERGAVEHSVTVNHEASVTGLPHDHAEQNAGLLFRTAVAALKQLTLDGRGPRIRAVAVTGQMHSTVLLNSAGHTLGNVITWQDRRAVRESANATLLEEFRRQTTAQAVHDSGCTPSAGYLGTTLFALKRLHQLPEGFCRASFVADWIVSRLTGEAPVTDRSHAASSGLYDFVRDEWSQDLLTAAGIEKSALPDVQDSGIPVGTISSAAAIESGLAKGTPVCNAIGDNQASVLSCLPSDDSSILINIGTGGQIVWRSNRFVRIEQIDTRYLPHDNPEGGCGHASDLRFMMVGAGLSGGDAIAWVNRTVRNWLSVFGLQLSDLDVWERLAEQIARNPTDDGLICEPFFRGTRHEPARRGLFSGVSNENFTPVHVAVSVLNGIAQSMFDAFTRSGRAALNPISRVIMSGNAAKRNPLLAAAIRRRFEVTVEVAGHSEEAATGTAMLAGTRLGIFSSIDAARKLVSEASGSAEQSIAPSDRAAGSAR